MTRTFFIFYSFYFLTIACWGQDSLRVHKNTVWLNRSIAQQFTLYTSDQNLSFQDFLEQKDQLAPTRLTHSVENLDFTNHYFFLHFVLENTSDRALQLFLETARPVTNTVELFEVNSGELFRSGDGIPVSEKAIFSNKSILPIQLSANSSASFVLKVGSDGETISLPMVFWEEKAFESHERSSQFSSGIFYGIFVFVILIYTTFFIQLNDRLFLLYAVYVTLTGLLQFTLDGYLHLYVLTDGKYWTQHSVILLAGMAVIAALMYARNYLKIQGKWGTITTVFALVVLATSILSLIPGKIYELTFPLINAFSLLSVIYLLLVALYLKRKDPSINNLFLIGLSMLLIGAVLFILGNFSVIDAPEITQQALKAGTLAEIICLSILMAGKYKQLQQEKEQAQAQLLVELEAKNRLISETNLRLEDEVRERTKEIETQRKELKEKNEDLVGSITYAKRIQDALLSNESKFKSILPQSFVFYRPKDIVSGDFYWIEKIAPTKRWPNGLTVYATADCTGHGVPGAFVSIICNNLLKLGKSDPTVQTTGEVLDFVNREINETLNSKYGEQQIRDGMDIALCAIDDKQKVLHFSGAKNGVLIVRNNEIIELKGDRKAIGFSGEELNGGFSSQTMPLQTGDLLYTFSDGIVDQFGGPLDKKWSSKRLKSFLLANALQPLEYQKNQLEKEFDEWKGQLEQLDDILVIGIRIP